MDFLIFWFRHWKYTCAVYPFTFFDHFCTFSPLIFKTNWSCLGCWLFFLKWPNCKTKGNQQFWSVHIPLPMFLYSRRFMGNKFFSYQMKILLYLQKKIWVISQCIGQDLFSPKKLMMWIFIENVYTKQHSWPALSNMVANHICLMKFNVPRLWSCFPQALMCRLYMYTTCCRLLLWLWILYLRVLNDQLLFWQSTHLILLNMLFTSRHLTLNHKSLSICLCSTLKLYPRRRITHNNDIYLPPTAGTMT